MTFLPFKVKNTIYSPNTHFISCYVEPQAVEQHIFGDLLQLKIKSGRHFIKFRWCMAANSCNLFSSRVWPDDGSQYAIMTLYIYIYVYAFCITLYQPSSEWSSTWYSGLAERRTCALKKKGHLHTHLYKTWNNLSKWKRSQGVHVLSWKNYSVQMNVFSVFPKKKPSVG